MNLEPERARAEARAPTGGRSRFFGFSPRRSVTLSFAANLPPVTPPGVFGGRSLAFLTDDCGFRTLIRSSDVGTSGSEPNTRWLPPFTSCLGVRSVSVTTSRVRVVLLILSPLNRSCRPIAHDVPFRPTIPQRARLAQTPSILP